MNSAKQIEEIFGKLKANDDDFIIYLDVLLKDRGNLEHAELLTKLNINGENLCKMYELSNRSTRLLIQTLDMIKDGFFTKNEIFENLENNESIPFIADRSIRNEQKFGNMNPNNINWKTYCIKNKTIYMDTLNQKNNKKLELKKEA